MKNRKPQHGPRPEIMRRTTAIGEAMKVAFEKAGFDVSRAVLPTKRENLWRVSRKA